MRAAAAASRGDYVIICDADLEYAPEQIPDLPAAVLNEEATVVYGTRRLGRQHLPLRLVRG